MLKNSFVILTAILLLSLSSRGQQQDGSVFATRITINQQNQTLNTILDQLSWQAGVYFSYDANLLKADKEYSIEAADKSLFTILNQLFNPIQFKLTELENQIIISGRVDEKQEIELYVDTIPVKYFFLSGKLIDDKKGDPIKYATISIYNKPIGTISNIDGDFLLKIHPENIHDTLIISCMGFSQIVIPAHKILDEDVFVMNAFSIRIREVKVTAISPTQLLKNIREYREINYSENTKLLTAFYRETVQQDGNYINVSEAIIEILKAPYTNRLRNDVVRLIKGRRSPDVKPFQWLNFKLQGGPFTIVKLDAVKTIESFIDEKFEKSYIYNVDRVIWYNENPVYVLSFKPVSEFIQQSYVGELYVHRESFAILHANFHLNKKGLKDAASVMIRKKPRGVKAKPTFVHYHVNYQKFQGKWQLATAQASVKFKIRSKRDKLNSEFHSISDLLITDIESTTLKKFSRDESFSQRDVFVELINEYDSKFWENYNIIKPDEDLRKAFKKYLGN